MKDCACLLSVLHLTVRCVCLSICLSICPLVFVCLHPSICPSVCVSVHPCLTSYIDGRLYYIKEEYINHNVDKHLAFNMEKKKLTK